MRLGEKYELKKKPGAVFTVTFEAQLQLAFGNHQETWIAEFQDNARRIHHFEEPKDAPGSLGLLPLF